MAFVCRGMHIRSAISWSPSSIRSLVLFYTIADSSRDPMRLVALLHYLKFWKQARFDIKPWEAKWFQVELSLELLQYTGLHVRHHIPGGLNLVVQFFEARINSKIDHVYILAHVIVTDIRYNVVFFPEVRIKCLHFATYVIGVVCHYTTNFLKKFQRPKSLQSSSVCTTGM